MLRVVVKRSKWNGNQIDEVPSSSKLLNDSGMMCCLGFACIAAGLRPFDIRGLAYVHEIDAIPEDLGSLVEAGRDHLMQSAISNLLTTANDNAPFEKVPRFASMSEKEAYIIEKGREAGLDFVFED